MNTTTRLDPEISKRPTPRRLAALIALSIFGSPLTAAAQQNGTSARAGFSPASNTEVAPSQIEIAPAAPAAVAAMPALPAEKPSAEPVERSPASALPVAERGSVKWEYRRLPPIMQSRAPSASPSEPARDELAPTEPKLSERWMLSIEGVTHAPVDVGVQAGIETPFGLRLFGGYGRMPSAYLGFLTQAAALASDEPATRAVFESGLDSGSTWRAQIGIRPFSRVGVYLDAGYSQLQLDGYIEPSELSELGLPGSAESGYAASTTLKMWLVELGYQAMIVDRIVLGAGIGVMGTLDAETELLAVDGGAASPALDEAAGAADQLLEKYGVLPTLTLRLGLDLI